MCGFKKIEGNVFAGHISFYHSDFNHKLNKLRKGGGGTGHVPTKTFRDLFAYLDNLVMDIKKAFQNGRI